MPRYAAIVLAIAVLTCGCNRNSAPAPPSAPTVPKPAVAPADEVVAAMPAIDSDAAPTADPAALPADAAQQGETEASEISAEEKLADEEPDNIKAAEPSTPERIALLTPGGPVIVDVSITVDGRPPAEVFNDLVKEVLDAADADKDGRPTWKELADNNDYLAALRPNAPPLGARQMKNYIERFDENHDGRVQPIEAAAWLGRDAGVTATAFALRSNRSYAANPRANSRVWQLLDANRDGELSIDETDRAAEKFMLLDGDDDRTVAPAELATLREQLEAERNRAIGITREVNRYAALHLDSNFDMDRLEYLLSDLYSPRQTLGPASFPDLAAFYESMDANSDGWLEQLELADFLSIDPHVEIAVAFSNSDAAKDAPTTVDVHHHVPGIAIAAKPSTDRVILRVGGTLLIVSAHDLASMQPVDQPQADDQRVERNQVRLMVHDEYDALFEELDANADGRLGEREILTCAERFRSRDTNGDARLSNNELPYSMIVAFLRGERTSEQSYYLPAAVTKRTTMAAAPEWFRHADFNGDGDVSQREFLGSLEQFAQLDSNNDGYLDAAEAAAANTQ